MLSPSALPPLERSSWLRFKVLHKCGQNRCGMCRFAVQTKTFGSVSDSHQFTICSFINCVMDHVIYLITCTRCNVQYIGYTIRNVKARIYEHIQGVKINADTMRNVSNVSKHFRDLHHGDLSHMQVIEWSLYPNQKGAGIGENWF